MLLCLLLQLHGQVADLLLLLSFLILLSDNLVHDLLNKTCSSKAGLVSLDNDLLARLNRLLCPDLHQVGAAIVLDNFGLDDLLSLWLSLLLSLWLTCLMS